MHPHSKHWNPIDYVIVRRCDIRDVLRCWAMRGAECWTDHQMIMAKVHMSVHPPLAETWVHGRRLNCTCLKDTRTRK